MAAAELSERLRCAECGGPVQAGGVEGVRKQQMLQAWTSTISALGRLRRKQKLEGHLSKSLTELHASQKIKLSNARDLVGNHRARLTKSQNGTVVGLNYSLLSRDRLLHVYSVRLAPLVMMFGAADSVGTALADMSDGEECDPGVIGYCSASDAAILVPDTQFCHSHGYASVRESIANGGEWQTRDQTLVWRGSTTGKGLISRDGMSLDDFALLHRTRMCLLLRNHPGTDVRLNRVVHSAHPELDESRLRTANIFGAHITSSDWSRRKYALDIDGNTNAWSNLFTRLLMGCCVIKVASPRNYRQWYYDELTPWEHYVPVASDMSDILEKIDWCRSHDAECRQIALRGQDFARRRTFETEIAQAVKRIERALVTGKQSASLESSRGEWKT
jgi:hypothetical protein